ncbi:MAG TPA: copper chaperone PCu(A)C [Caulobacter sp.]|nr:copper chaperone PCu(A)C [Caulobacter sp.]
MKPFAIAAALTLLAAPVLAASSTIEVAQAWSRPAPQGGNGAGYAVITNHGATADTLVAASSPVAARIEIHESMIMGGQAMMHPRPGGLPVPAGATVALKPGGWHMMLMGLKQPLKAGDQFPATLTFRKAGRMTVQFSVQATAPAN